MKVTAQPRVCKGGTGTPRSGMSESPAASRDPAGASEMKHHEGVEVTAPAAPVAKSIESAGYLQRLGAMPPRASKHYVGGNGTPTALPYPTKLGQGRTGTDNSAGRGNGSRLIELYCRVIEAARGSDHKASEGGTG